MACSLTTVQEAACESGFGQVTDEIALLRLIAQNFANWLSAVSPGAEVSVEAILERACESGVGQVSDEIKLLQLTAQNLCNQIT